MVHSTKHLVLTLLILGFAGTSSAQVFAFADGNSTNPFRRTNSNPGVEIQNNTVSENSKLVMAYKHSEQFVFDNLSSLKKEFTISDIYYNLDEATIRPDAQLVLDNLANLLMEQPVICVAVTAHCDSRMLQYNEKLALRRAEAARAYLVSKGISQSRIVLEKHGRPSVKNPCAGNPNCTLTEQQLNRRTEFNIIYNDINLAYVSSFNEKE